MDMMRCNNVTVVHVLREIVEEVHSTVPPSKVVLKAEEETMAIHHTVVPTMGTSNTIPSIMDPLHMVRMDIIVALIMAFPVKEGLNIMLHFLLQRLEILPT